MEDALQGLAEARGPLPFVGKLILLAVKLQHPFPGKDLLHDLHVLFEARHGLAVGHAVPAFHHLRARGPQAHNEAVVGELR